MERTRTKLDRIREWLDVQLYKLRSKLTKPFKLEYDETLELFIVKTKRCLVVVYYRESNGAWTIVTTYAKHNYDRLYRTGTGQLLCTHTIEYCKGEHCPIHTPSNHHMVDWPTNWRDDNGVMERMCPHGIGHPDPDDYYVKQDKYIGTHGCDGCCNPRTKDKIKAGELMTSVRETPRPIDCNKELPDA